MLLFYCYAKRIGWEDTLTTSLASKDFPFKDQIQELSTVTILFCVFPTNNTFNFPVIITF